MKIYAVNTGTRRLWTNYQSAAQSAAYWERRYPGQVVLESVHVPEDAWKPVDKANESRLNRVATLWEELARSDQEGLDALLDDLVKRLAPAKKPVLSASEKTEAMAALDRLVA